MGGSTLKKTSKLVMAVAQGIDIVTEKWITQAQRLGDFPPLKNYLPLDVTTELSWKFNLRDATERGKQGLTHLLSGTTVYFTRQLRKDLGGLERDLAQIATMLGANGVKKRLPAAKDKEHLSENNTLIIGVANDPEGAKVGRLEQKLYNKDMLTMAALRGVVERNSNDFLLDVPIKMEVD
jgi:hypothetical protein